MAEMFDWDAELLRRRTAAAQAGQDAADGAEDLILEAGEDACRVPEQRDTIIDGALHQGAITLVYGKPKSGKSFLAMDQFLAIAEPARTLWMGMPIKQHGPVLYVACEGHGGYWKRLVAARPIPPWFMLARGRPALISDQDGRGYSYEPHARSVYRAIEKTAARFSRMPIAVAIDTVWQSFGGANVNDSVPMMAYVRMAAAIANEGIGVVLVHHATKGNGTPAGSVSLMGGVDTIIAVERHNGAHLWTVELAKDDPDGRGRCFKLQVVNGIDGPEGDTVSSCKVVDLGWDEPEPKAENKTMPRGERPDAVLAMLHELLRTTKPNGSCPAGMVPIATWRDAVMQRVFATLDPNAQRVAWHRATKQLVQNQLVLVDGDWAQPMGGLS